MLTRLIKQFERDINKKKFDYIQQLMQFIPDKDLLKLYEKHRKFFIFIQSLSEEELYERPKVLDEAIVIFKSWLYNNYNSI